MSGNPIYLDNDFEPEYYVARKNIDTRELEPVSGLSGLRVYLSATDGGTTIHADLSKLLTERASAPGYYFARYEGDDLRTHLASLRGVYEAFGDGTNTFTFVYRRVFPLRRA